MKSKTSTVCRKIRDSLGNLYVFELPKDTDVNVDSIQDILLSTTQRISKLLAYRLVGEVYRTPQDNQPLGTKAKAYNSVSCKELSLLDEDLDQAEFGKMVQDILAISKEQRINKVKLTEFKGRPVLQDQKGYYWEEQVPCVVTACQHVIPGKHRLSLNREGDSISRSQMFVPIDNKAQRVRPNSKNWLCSTCAIKHISLPEDTIRWDKEATRTGAVPFSEAIGEPAPIPEKVLGGTSDDLNDIPEVETPAQALVREISAYNKSQQRTIYEVLEELSSPNCTIDPLFLKGVVYAYCVMRKEAI